MINKQLFSQRLNNELNKMGVPVPPSERTVALVKLLQPPSRHQKSPYLINRYIANSLLNGQLVPEPKLLQAICDLFGLNIEELKSKPLGKRASAEEKSSDKG